MPLCIGGPMDGKWIDTDLHSYYVYIDTQDFYASCHNYKCNSIIHFEYKREYLANKDDKYPIFVPANESIILIEILINNYRPIKE